MPNRRLMPELLGRGQPGIPRKHARITCSSQNSSSGLRGWCTVGCIALAAARREQRDRAAGRGMHLRRPVWHHGALGANNDPLVARTRAVLAQVLDERTRLIKRSW